jgi:hypothetical protein
VREAKGELAAKRIAHLKKGEMAAQAQDLLAEFGWLPEPLRTPGQSMSKTTAAVPDADADQPFVVQAEVLDQTVDPTENPAEDPLRDPAAMPTADWSSAAD